MSWVFNSKRVEGTPAHPPRCEFYIGTVCIGYIEMLGRPWTYHLHTAESEPVQVPSFGAGLKELHRRLNGVPPPDHRVG